MKPPRSKSFVFGLLAWLIALAFFFPILWMTLTAFKTEQAAYSTGLTEGVAPVLPTFSS